MVTDRGQIHTLEAFISVMLIVGALLFASQATAVTPLSASTSNQHIENQQQTMANDVLDIAAEEGSLRTALTHWNLSQSDDDIPPHFEGVSDPNRSTYSSIVNRDHPLNTTFETAFGTGVYAYNIELRYLDANGNFEVADLVVMGTPSDNAITASRTVTLFDDDEIVTGEALEDIEDDFWAPDADAESDLYNVVEVRMTIWRM